MVFSSCSASIALDEVSMPRSAFSFDTACGTVQQNPNASIDERNNNFQVSSRAMRLNRNLCKQKILSAKSSGRSTRLGSPTNGSVRIHTSVARAAPFPTQTEKMQLKGSSQQGHMISGVGRAILLEP